MVTHFAIASLVASHSSGDGKAGGDLWEGEEKDKPFLLFSLSFCFHSHFTSVIKNSSSLSPSQLKEKGGAVQRQRFTRRHRNSNRRLSISGHFAPTMLLGFGRGILS
ncbi:hypothetical protein L1987_21695 [Smallanthus sonchifolius]|uniref:Uncharacterized protein n=1 Tax=Smallanthus sonchifolius TaxID=185202 RepID=A0ACB9IC24_9ASTR|nr:hypothetical protein L1987_21695 [Smallanthus sonchifolius]